MSGEIRPTFSGCACAAGVSRALLALLALLLCAVASGADISREYQIKAAFLYNFARFTSWPTNAFASPDASLVIGVLGVDPFGSALDDTVRGEVVDGHQLAVERYSRFEDIKTCHILFISQSERYQLESIVAKLGRKPVLTVSDTEGAAFRGAMIRLFEENNRIRFRINLSAVQGANLTLSSKLLRLGEAVPGRTAP